VISYANVETLFIEKTYSHKDDVCMYKGTDNLIKIKKGMFYILYPQDAHKCCCHDSVSSLVKKIVIKMLFIK